jgi:hypothetical protein
VAPALAWQHWLRNRTAMRFTIFLAAAGAALFFHPGAPLKLCGAASRYGSGSIKMMRLRKAQAPPVLPDSSVHRYFAQI